MLGDRHDQAELVVEQPEVTVGLVEGDAELVRGARWEAHRGDVVRDRSRHVAVEICLLIDHQIHPELDVPVCHRLAIRPPVMVH